MSLEAQLGEMRTATRDGRTIAWSCFGDPGGAPVVYFHGAGGSRLEAQIMGADAAKAGLRIISIDRPGSGHTDALPGRSILSSVEDMPVVLAAEGVQRVPTSGLSAGAMYAWAAAQVYDHSVTGVVAISPAVPAADPRVRPALSTQFKTTAFLATRAPWMLAALQRRQAKSQERPDGHARYVKGFRKVSPVDADVLEDDGVYAWFHTTSTEGRRQGRSGTGGEEFAFMTRPWGFDPGALTVPCKVIIGEADPLAPAHRAFLAGSPGCDGRVIAGGGHILIATDEGRAAVLEAMVSLIGTGEQ